MSGATLRELAQALAPAPGSSLAIRQAEVTAISASYTISVKVAGSSVVVSGVQYMGAAIPQIGKSVWLIVAPPDMYALGAIASVTSHPAADVYRNSGLTVNNNTTTTINMDTAVSDPWNMLSGGALVAPLPGYFNISGVASLQAGSAAGVRLASLRVNGNLIAAANRPPVATNTFTHVSKMGVKLAQGDAVTLSCLHTDGAALSLNAGAGNTVLSMAYAGPAPN